MNAIEVKNLSVWYGKFQALKNASFYIPEDAVAGLIGPNGAGKTTLIKSIVGFLPYNGEISISRKEKMIGYLSENEGYYEYMTGYEYLRYFGEVYEIENLNSEIKNVLKMVGLDGKDNLIIKKYSRGMKRRLGIARTLLSKSKIIILDEPMSGLDPKIKAELRDIIVNISEEKTFLVSSHQLRDIEDVCNWIILINEGKVLDSGRPEDILKRVNPQRLITLQIMDSAASILESIKRIDGVKDVILRGNILEIRYEGTDDSVIFKYLVERGIKFTIKSDTLESIYREVYK